MRATYPLFLVLNIVSTSLCAQGNIGIGQWRDHYPYSNARLVIEANGVAYCASRNAIFKADPATNELEKLSKVNALSDVDITALGWNAGLNALLVGYANGNFDMVKGETATNIGDIKRSGLIGDKRIYEITCQGDLAYLSCGFGIVVLDLVRQEVRETWIIGTNGAQVQVNAVAFMPDSIYAATEAGLFSAWRGETNLAAFTNWHKRLDVPQPNGRFSDVETFSGRLFVNGDFGATGAELDTIYYWDSGWQRLTDAYSRDNRSISVSPDGQRMVVGVAYELRQYDASLNRVFQGADGFILKGAWGASDGGAWVASDNLGLVRLPAGGGSIKIVPNGPRNTGALKLDAQGGWLMVATGSVAGNWTNTFGHLGIHVYHDNTWRTVQEADDVLMLGVNGLGGGAVDPMAVSMDPDDPGHGYTGSWEEGVLEWRNGSVQAIWNATNSSLGTNGDAANGVVNVAGLDFDKDGNLWVTNANTNAILSVRKKGGEWKSFSPGNLLAGNNLVSEITCAHENDLKWIIRPRGNALLVFTDGGTIDDTGDDQFKLLTTSENQGKLPSLEVASVAEDLDGEVWVGTGKGIAVFYNPGAIFSETGENFDCQQILIEQDGNVQILLETEVVGAIAVDGANRKWLGTQASGAFLVSQDGTRELAHFTAENSPLPSNNITAITIDGITGEVFFATDQGIISYRGEATDGVREATCASVFPNPVRESYQGPVAITGLAADSDVRITDIAGNLVYKTTSLGGQAIWPATDLAGQRVSTGVYLVMAADPTGATTCNTKVLVVR
ncbi:MAG: hypothetical protein IPO90_16525 [Flavobacteriales bacterium]|nr:hypothetical protein [Flavobacteriales bacterium]